MKFLLYMMVFLLVGGLICSKTLPDRDTHLRSVSAALVDEVEAGNLFSGVMDTHLAEQVTDVNFVSECIDKIFVVEDYGVFTLGKVRWMNKEYVVSLGILGRIFNFSDAKAAEDYVMSLKESLVH